MAVKAQTSTRRILNELQNYEREPSEALLHLAPVNDDDLMHWTAVMKGVSGTAYEGETDALYYSICLDMSYFKFYGVMVDLYVLITFRRWTVAA